MPLYRVAHNLLWAADMDVLMVELVHSTEVATHYREKRREGLS